MANVTHITSVRMIDNVSVLCGFSTLHVNRCELCQFSAIFVEATVQSEHVFGVENKKKNGKLPSCAHSIKMLQKHTKFTSQTLYM